VADSYSVAADGSLSVDGGGVLSNDRGSGLSAKLISSTAHGSLVLNADGSFSYTPSGNFSGVDQFTYKDVDRNFNSSNVAAVTLTVTPLAAANSYDTTPGTPLSVPTPGVLAGAAGSGLSARLVANVSHGVLALAGDGSFTYTPSAGYSGSDSFSYQAVDASGDASPAATVTINVEQPAAPAVVPQTYAGAVGNTELQVGGTRGDGPEVFLAGTSALAGDSDPSGGTLSTTAGTIATTEGGSVTMQADGEFAYAPPVGYDGSNDSFAYEVNSSDGQSSEASATIDFVAARVWYVDDTAAAGGDGTSGAPFTTLATAAAASSPGDVIFLAGSTVDYGGGITLQADQSLLGASTGLTVDGTTLVPASATASTVTNATGAGITLADGDTVDGLAVAAPAGDGVDASGVDSFTLGGGVSISEAGGDGLDVSGGDGTIDSAASISGAAGHSVAISGRSGGTVTLSGAIGDTADGVLLSDNPGAEIDFSGELTADTGADPAFTATDGGSISVTGAGSTLRTTTATALDVENTTIATTGLSFASVSAGTGSSGPGEAIVLDNTGSGGLSIVGQTGVAGSAGTIENATATGATSGAIALTQTGPVSLSELDLSANAGNGVYADDVASLSLGDSSIAGSGGDGVLETGNGTIASSFAIEDDTLTGQAGTAIDVDLAGDSSGFVEYDTIGSGAVAGSGSSGGDGIDIDNDAGTVAVELDDDTIASIAAGYGISGQALDGGTLNLKATNNTISMNGGSSLDATNYASMGDGPSELCLDTADNTAVAAGEDANGTSVVQGAGGSVFEIAGYSGSPTDLAGVESYLEGQDSLTGGSGGAAADAELLAGNSDGFTAAACTAPGGGGGT
jgi:hypothetical protein